MFFFRLIFTICLFPLLSNIFHVKAEAVEVFPKYKMIDLGTLETDYSRAIAINEKGQVLGTIKEGEIESIFIWEEKNGLKIIELSGSTRDLFLNNNGQIAGCRYDRQGGQQAFIWDQTKGFINVNCGNGEVEVRGFNDKAQVIGDFYDLEKS